MNRSRIALAADTLLIATAARCTIAAPAASAGKLAIGCEADNFLRSSSQFVSDTAGYFKTLVAADFDHRPAIDPP